MKKTVCFLLILLMLSGMLILPSAAVSANAQVTIKAASVVPTINGIVSAGEYGEKIHSVDYDSDEFISDYDQDKSVESDFYMTWTEGSLYMAWVVHSDDHWPIPEDHEGGLGYMWQYSCVQFMLCTGAPDASKPGTYQTGQWSGNYLEAGLSVMSDGSSYKVAWSLPVGGESLTVDDWDFSGVRDETSKTTTYEVRLPWSKIGIKSIGSGTQFGLTYAVATQEHFDIEPQMAEWQDAIIGGKNMDAGAVITLSDETTDGDITGSPLENPDYNIILDAPEQYVPGDTIEVTLTLNDIAAEGGFGLVHLLLYYDADKVEPLIKNYLEVDNAYMDNFLESAPSINQWEGLCKLEEEYSRYDISFMTTQQNTHAKEDGEVVIKVWFTVKSGADGDIVFQVPHSSTFCADYDLNKYYGNAGKVSVSKGEEPDFMGSPMEDPDYTLEVYASDFYYPGYVVFVVITVRDIVPADGLNLIQFNLYYDSTAVEPIYINDPSNDNFNMTEFIVTAPNIKSWESFCRLQEEHSRYDLAFLTTRADSSSKEDDSLIIMVPFLINPDTEEDILFYVPHNENKALSYSMVDYYGNGGMAALSAGSVEPLELNEQSKLIIDEENGFLIGAHSGLTAGSLQSMFKGEVMIFNNDGEPVSDNQPIGTGFIITNGVQVISVVILGDGNGDGVVNAKDYTLAKRAFLGTYTLEGPMLRAVCIEGRSAPTAKDYIKIKRHFLGTHNLYET